MKKFILVSMLMVLMVAGNANAQTEKESQHGVTGAQLLEWLTIGEITPEFTLAVGYLGGAVHMHNYYQINGVPTINNKGEPADWPINCIPTKTSNTALGVSWVKWAASSGKLMPNQPALVGILMWLYDSYPCLKEFK